MYDRKLGLVGRVVRSKGTEALPPPSITIWPETADGGSIAACHASRGKPDQEFSCCIRLIEQ
jgi:hypothetical protein